MPQPQGKQSASGLSKTVQDISIIAVIIVTTIIIIVSISVYLILRFLRTVVDGAGGIMPSVGCSAWLEARRASYAEYPNCEAATRAIADAQTMSHGACPAGTAAEQASYAKTQNCGD